MKLFTE